MSMLRMCLDRRVIVGLVGMGVALFLVAPGLVGPALPLLFLAVCPLSMLFMASGMRGMPGQGVANEVPGTTEDAAALRASLVKLDAERATLVTAIAERARSDGGGELPNAGPAAQRS